MLRRECHPRPALTGMCRVGICRQRLSHPPRRWFQADRGNTPRTATEQTGVEGGEAGSGEKYCIFNVFHCFQHRFWRVKTAEWIVTRGRSTAKSLCEDQGYCRGGACRVFCACGSVSLARAATLFRDMKNKLFAKMRQNAPKQHFPARV